MNIDYDLEYKRLNKNDFIELNDRLINWYISKKIINTQNVLYKLEMEFDELKVELYINLIKAYDYFKPESGIKWTTFAIHVLQNRMYVFYKKLKQKRLNTISLSEPINDKGNIISDVIGEEDTNLEKCIENDFIDKFYIELKNNLSKKENELLDLIHNRDFKDQYEIIAHTKTSRQAVSAKLIHIAKRGRMLAQVV